LAVVAVPQLRAPGAGSDTKVEMAKNGGPEVPRDPDIVRSAELEAYLAAHRDSSGGTVTSPNEYVITPATLTTESR